MKNSVIRQRGFTIVELLIVIELGLEWNGTWLNFDRSAAVIIAK